MMSFSCCVGQEASDQLQKADSDAETHAIIATSTVIRAATAIVLLAPVRKSHLTFPPRAFKSSLEIASAPWGSWIGVRAGITWYTALSAVGH